MANKYHRQGFKLGSGKKLIEKAGEAFKNIYKTNKKKENLIDQLNKNLEKQRKKTKAKPEQEPYNLDVYTDVMVSDFDKKTGPYFDRLKKLKGKK